MSTKFSRWLHQIYNPLNDRQDVASDYGQGLRDTLNFLEKGAASLPESLREKISFDEATGAIRVYDRLLKIEKIEDDPWILPSGEREVSVRFSVINNPSMLGPTVTFSSSDGLEENLLAVLAVSQPVQSTFTPLMRRVVSEADASKSVTTAPQSPVINQLDRKQRSEQEMIAHLGLNNNATLQDVEKNHYNLSAELRRDTSEKVLNRQIINSMTQSMLIASLIKEYGYTIVDTENIEENKHVDLDIILDHKVIPTGRIRYVSVKNLHSLADSTVNDFIIITSKMRSKTIDIDDFYHENSDQGKSYKDRKISDERENRRNWIKNRL